MSISALYYFKIKRASRDIEIPLCLPWYIFEQGDPHMGGFGCVLQDRD